MSECEHKWALYASFHGRKALPSQIIAKGAAAYDLTSFCMLCGMRNPSETDGRPASESRVESPAQSADQV